MLSHVVDPNAKNAAAIAAETGAAVATFAEVLAADDVCGIVVATSTDTHLDYCLQAQAAGKAIFCEKPIGLDLGRAPAAS